jgi:transcriptional regulator with XRE-family HTH domain
VNWQAFGQSVEAHRGRKSLREVQQETGISAPTLSRVERGHRPDVETFGRLCRWMRTDANQWLGITDPAPLPNGERRKIAAMLRVIAEWTEKGP